VHGQLRKDAFRGDETLTKVVLPEGVTSIEAGTFYFCTRLQEIALPATLATIGRSTFRECSSLQKIALPATLVAIGEGAFKGCSSLRDEGSCSLTTLFIVPPSTAAATTIAATLWSTAFSYHLSHIARVWALDAIIAVLGGPFETYTRYADLLSTLQAAPARIQSWTGVELWRWWTPPDVAGHFRRLSVQYRAMVRTVLLACERHAASFGDV
jgi:hypothetical protein